MNMLPALLLAAVGVGVGHAVMPDHWLPLAVLSRTGRYRTGRVVRLSLAAAFAHVVVSLLLGGILIVVGLEFRTTVARHADLVVGAILLVTGAVFLILDVTGKGHGHSHHAGDGHPHGQGHHHDHGHRDHGHHEHGQHDQGHDVHGHHDHGHDGHVDHSHDGCRQHDRATAAVLDRPESPPRNRSARGLAGLLVPFGAAASPDLTILPVFLAASALGTAAALGSLIAFSLATIATIVGLTTATALGARLLPAAWIDRRANLITALTLVAIGALVAAGLI